jgi:hypothetical protein
MRLSESCARAHAGGGGGARCRKHSLQIAGAFSPAPRPGRPRVYVYACRVGGPPPLAPPGWGLLGRTSLRFALAHGPRGGVVSKFIDRISRTTAHVSPWRPTGIVGSSHAPSGIQPGGIRSNFCNEESIVSHAWPRMVYVTTCGLNWPGSSRLVALTAISSGIATNVR